MSDLGEAEEKQKLDQPVILNEKSDIEALVLITETELEFPSMKEDKGFQLVESIAGSDVGFCVNSSLSVCS